MSKFSRLGKREQIVRHVHELERLTAEKKEAGDALRDAFEAADADGLDPHTLKVVLKLRTMSPLQREERRALEGIYLAALGMLDGDALSDAARRRLDGQPPPPPRKDPPPGPDGGLPDVAPPDDETGPPPSPSTPQPILPLKTVDEAHQEGMAAAAAGARIYDNPFPAGDPCRAAWDEGWCAQKKSHGMEPPAAYQRKVDKPPAEPKGDDDTPKKGAA